MCFVAFHTNPKDLNPNCPYEMILVSNREERFDRETASLHKWSNGVIAGKDNVAGGTWLAFDPETMLVAILTNIHDNQVGPAFKRDPNAPSRGSLALKAIDIYQSLILEKDQPFSKERKSLQVLEIISKDAYKYQGFNLMLIECNFKFFCCLSNRPEPLISKWDHCNEAFVIVNITMSKSDKDQPEPDEIEESPKQYGCNFSSYPKIERGKRLLEDAIKNCKDFTHATEYLYQNVLLDNIPTSTRDIKGGENEKEILLDATSRIFMSPIRVAGNLCGTRSSMIILIDNKGNFKVTERDWRSNPATDIEIDQDQK